MQPVTGTVQSSGIPDGANSDRVMGLTLRPIMTLVAVNERYTIKFYGAKHKETTIFFWADKLALDELGNTLCAHHAEILPI